MNKVLDSKYIIDGLAMELTPARILGLQAACNDGEDSARTEPCTIIDETVDPPLDALRRTRITIAEAVLDSLWRKGDFTIGDLSVSLEWRWENNGIGKMAAFYESVKVAAEYLEGLDIPIHGATFVESSPVSLEVRTNHSNAGRALPETTVKDPDSWIVFVPFDTDGYLLNEPADTDYFIDAYEVVRELVVDGVAISAHTATVDNIPGAVLQIRDSDFDYIDAEFLLQDVAFYPVGHPTEDGREPEIRINHDSGINKILASIIRSHSSEGED